MLKDLEILFWLCNLVPFVIKLVNSQLHELLSVQKFSNNRFAGEKIIQFDFHGHFAGRPRWRQIEFYAGKMRLLY